LYSPLGQKPAYPQYLAALRTSWNGYIKTVLQDAAPAGIICIGKGVRTALRDQLDALKIPWGTVPQPQARITAAESFKVFKALRLATQEPARVRSLTAAWAGMIPEPEVPPDAGTPG
jgi:hypothetical protein